MSETVPNQWLVDVAARTQHALHVEHHLAVAVTPFVQAVPPEELPAEMAGVRITGGGLTRAHRVGVRPPRASANNVFDEVKRVVDLFLAAKDTVS